jgi:hypothetical protein
MVALYGFFADPSDIAKQVDTLSGVLPGGAIDVIRDQLNRLVSQGATKLGFAFLVSFAISLWSANAGMKSIFDALNSLTDWRRRKSRRHSVPSPRWRFQQLSSPKWPARMRSSSPKRTHIIGRAELNSQTLVVICSI